VSVTPDHLRNPDFATLREVEQRILWLAVRMVDHANRRSEAEIKVGGHQASSASIVSIMTALWFAHLGGDDKVAVKPHASPVYHAIKYLTGELDRRYLTSLRAKGGLQAYPSRTKDPDVADFSTGSVGLGAVAPLFSAAVRRYVDAHFGQRPAARFVSIAGDAELDEGNVWEAISDPALQGLGNVMLIIDFNRQSLDRVVPGIQARKLESFFGEAGWHVAKAKYGRRLQAVFAQSGGEDLRRHIDDMSNEEYQSLFAFEGSELRERFLAGADPAVAQLLESVDDRDLGRLIRDLGGHDLEVLLEAYRECDRVTDRPSVVFAYTVKGWRLPIAGDPLNHAALLTPAQIDELRVRVGLTVESEWDRFPVDTGAGDLCARVGREINNVPPPPPPVLPVPETSGSVVPSSSSTQDAFGRILVRLGRNEVLAQKMVTASPDVSISTNLGGWINHHGVFSAAERPDFFGEDRLLRWAPSPRGHHIELGISEMNLFLMLGQLGMSLDHHGEHLLPIGTVYDPFVLRGLDALIYSLYNGARFVVVGTPSGVTLASEGGAHQSTITPSVVLELPGIAACEPAYAGALDWLFCHALAQLADHDGESVYFRLSTRPIDQAPFEEARRRVGTSALRAAVLAGGYRLREPGVGEPLVIAASGPVMPEVLEAAATLEEEGLGVTVIDVTSLELIYRQWKRALEGAAASAQAAQSLGHLETLILPAERAAPIVTVHDAASHSMAWLGSVFGQRVLPVGVDRFGESGSIRELYGSFGLLPGQIVNAALVAHEL
jgi:pyruvate dehydrogenase E1 component